VWRAELRKDIPKNAKVLTSTWATKKNASGRFRERLNARGYEQVDREHFDSTNMLSPLINDAATRIIMVVAIYSDAVLG
jgi:ATP phosphoribosyltransferase regulatory subunit HisZ